MNERVLVLLAVLAGLAGCTPTSGVITDVSGTTDLQVGATVPDVEYESREGNHASFDAVRQPVTIVAFVAPEGERCCWLNPQIVNFADQFSSLPVTVAQFSLPTSRCPHGPGCVEVCNLREGRVISLCDADRLAWRAYGQPAPGSLILIGKDDKVLMTGSLSNPQPILTEAERLGQIERELTPEADRLDLYL